jgi:mannose-6-phosphate isomerase-like protein (cupin superfamily)
VAGEHLNAEARRVVSGLDRDGRSAIVSDENTTTRLAAEAFTVCDIWQVTGLPTKVAADTTLTSDVVLDPPLAGFTYRVTTFPPDSEWDPAASYQDSLAAMGGAGAHVADDGGIPGLHQTDTVDIITVLSGELHAVLETGEAHLRPGDSFVQRGTKHTWSNRGDVPCTIVAVQMGATR